MNQFRPKTPYIATHAVPRSQFKSRIENMKQTLITTLYTLLFTATGASSILQPAFGASASSTALQNVLKSTAVSQVSNFKFELKNKVLHSIQKANFNLSGASNKTFTVALSKRIIFLKSTKAGNVIALQGVQPAPFGATKIKKNGLKRFSIALLKNQKIGTVNKNLYSGKVMIDVVY